MAVSKQIVSSRGFKYNYLFSPAKDGKQTILFVHGFPSTSHDWRLQIPFFENEGYGLIVPDMLGYGGTDKPTDATKYKSSQIAADLVDILNAESLDKVIAIGHDWGSIITSRLGNCHPERFLAFGFLAVGYVAPSPTFDLDMVLQFMKQKVGYEPYGYWKFLASHDAHQVIEQNFDSFCNVVFPADPRIWVTHMAPSGALEASLRSGFTSPLPSYLTEEDKALTKGLLLKGGLEAPLCYYKVMAQGHSVEDDKSIPVDRYKLSQPCFLGAAKQDYVCIAQFQMHSTSMYCESLTVKEFDTAHWVQLEAPAELNKELLTWIRGLEKS